MAGTRRPVAQRFGDCRVTVRQPSKGLAQNGGGFSGTKGGICLRLQNLRPPAGDIRENLLTPAVQAQHFQPLGNRMSEGTVQGLMPDPLKSSQANPSAGLPRELRPFIPQQQPAISSGDKQKQQYNTAAIRARFLSL